MVDEKRFSCCDLVRDGLVFKMVIWKDVGNFGEVDFYVDFESKVMIYR